MPDKKLLPHILLKYAFVTGIISILLGALILTGWLYDISLLKLMLGYFVAIKVNTAICFILSGISIIIQLSSKRSRLPIMVSEIFASAIALTGFLTLLEYIFNIDLGIDQLIVSESMNHMTPFPGRMAQNTALAFIFTGIALFINGIERRWKLHHLILAILSSGIAGMGIATIIGYFAGIVSLAADYRLPLMAVPTAVIFIIIGTGILSAALAEGRWELSFDRDALNWLGGGLAVILVVSLFTYRSTLMLLENDLQVNRINTVMQKIEQVISDLKDAETGQRGYIITGKKPYLEPYFKGKNEAAGDIADLKNLIREDPGQLKRINIAEDLARRKFEELEMTISVRDSEGFAASQRIVISDHGKALMDSIRMICNEMEKAESSRELQGHQKTSDTANMTLYLIPLGVLLSISLLLAAIYFMGIENKRRKIAEERLSRSNDELELRVKERTKELMRSNAELEQFAYAASHDLQEPLRMVSIYSTKLERDLKDKLNDNTKQFLEILIDNSKRMHALITGLLEYSRISSIKEEASYVDMNNVTGEVLKELSLSINESQAEIKVGTLPKVKADPLQMKMLMQNLISNAVKFTNDTRPHIEVKAEKIKGEIVYSVKDNGIGINPENYDKIFVIFQRLHNREVYPGTGIGLSLCKRIVENHGGRIWVESEPGKGATFYFTL